MLSFLLTQCDERDRYKIEHLYYTFHSDMIKAARVKLHSGGVRNYELDAEDVVQNLYLRLTKYIHNIDITWPEPRLKAYMNASLNHAIADYYNNANKRISVCELNENTTISIDEENFLALLNIHERYEEVVEAINQLDPIYQATLTFKYMNDMDINDIADFMGVPSKTVYTRIERGQKYLLNLLGVVNLNGDK